MHLLLINAGCVRPAASLCRAHNDRVGQRDVLATVRQPKHPDVKDPQPTAIGREARRDPGITAVFKHM